VRPADWLEIPTIAETDEKFAGLLAIYDCPLNPVGLSFGGNFTVNWGDGTVENFSSGDTATHSYSYSSIPSSTLTTRGYKQVVITVTAQQGSQLTSMDLTVGDDRITGNTPAIPWLDICVSMPNAESGASFLIDGYDSQDSFPYAWPNTLERMQLLNAGGCTSFNELLYNQAALQVFVLGPNIVSGFANIFYTWNLNTLKFQNTSLDCVYAILDNTSIGYYNDGYQGFSLYMDNISSEASAVSYLSDFQSIRKVVINGMPDVVDASYLFQNCNQLQSAYIHNVPNIEVCSSMFDSCYGLKTVVVGDCPQLRDSGYMFNQCESLYNVSFGDTPMLEISYDMFENCYSLEKAPDLNLSSVTDVNYMFRSCYSLQEVPNYSTPLVEYSYSMFQSCYSLAAAPTLNTGAVIDADYMFSGCYGIRTVPAYDLSQCTESGDLYHIFANCPMLQSMDAINISTDLDLSNCLLSREAIVNVFNNLATIPADSATITVSDNFGSADLQQSDINIALNKGWTVSY
jgi:hypothetical protein